MTLFGVIGDSIIIAVLVHNHEYALAAGWFSSCLFLRMYQWNRAQAERVNKGKK